MAWSDLKGQEITNVYYQDEFGGIGHAIKEHNFHLIEQGNVYFEVANNSFFEVLNDDEKGGITITQISYSFKEQLHSNKIEKDTYWSTISNKKVVDILIYKDVYLEGFKNETQQKEIVSTIEIVFQNGERIFISNAGFISKNEIISLTDDFLIYRKKKIGVELNLIKY